METSGANEQPGKLITLHLASATKGSKDMPLRFDEEGKPVRSPVLVGWTHLGSRDPLHQSDVTMFTNKESDYLKVSRVRILCALHFIGMPRTDIYYALPPRIVDEEYHQMPDDLKNNDELLEEIVNQNKNGKPFVNIEAGNPSRERIMDALLIRQLRFMEYVIDHPDIVRKYIEEPITGK